MARLISLQADGSPMQAPLACSPTSSFGGSGAEDTTPSTRLRGEHRWWHGASVFLIIFGLVGAAVLAFGRALANEGEYDWSKTPLQDARPVAEDIGEVEGCHDITMADHGSCLKEIDLARRAGVIPNIKRFTGGVGGLTLPNRSAPLVEWQALVYKTAREKCPRPCTMRRSSFCKNTTAPVMWKPATPKEILQVKALSYNLFWWNLFGQKKGIYNKIHDSAGKLIAASMTPPYDVMGFQECENYSKVLEPVGLLKQYKVFQGTHAVCMAYKLDTWSLLDRGEADVAEDQASEYYGLRASQWMRLRHISTGQTLFFVNHHGPLHVNSGGECGGVSTAHNLLNLIADKAEQGDAVILVGDFNANAASLTIQELWKHLVLLYSGESFGGVDNIFSNVGASSLVETVKVGSGGSDHDAISATVKWGSSDTVSLRGSRTYQPLAPMKAVRDSIDSECGLVEPGVAYTFQENSWTRHINGIQDRRCCALCKMDESCKAWVAVDWSHASRGPRCTLYGGELVRKVSRNGVVSGLPPAAATKAAEKAAVEAISEVGY